jgi:hypothetical protein
MADLRISELPALAGANLAGGDLLPVVDISASETKKITVQDAIGFGVTLIADATIPGAKILFNSASIPGSALVASAVDTTQINAAAVTAAKLANESTVDLVTTLPASGAFTGQLALDTDDLKTYCWDGASWQSIKAAGSINSVVGTTAGVINIGISTTGDTVTISATLDDTSAAAQFLAGPTAAAGAASYRTIVGDDLPVATAGGKGAISVNGEGLRMDGNLIEINNDVTASGSTYSVVNYDTKGLITAGRAITGSDLPVATSVVKGAVIPGTGLAVDGSGTINHSSTATPGTYTKVTVDAQGHVSTGTTLTDADIPDHSAAKLTTGALDAARIANSVITGPKLANYAVSKFGSTLPTADHIGQFFFNPLIRELFLWDGNVYQPVGISAGEIVLAGTYNATTNLLSSVTADGTAAGFVSGSALPSASATNSNYYVVVSTGGTGTSPAPTVTLDPPDLLLSNGTSYIKLDVSDTITAVTANNVGFTPYGNIAASNVQTALQELDDEKLAKAGGVVTGALEIGAAGSLVFEGSTADGFETTLAVVDPTADRTVTLPNVTGTVVTTGDTGTVTSTMILDGTIVNADVNASAAIAGTKIEAGTTSVRGTVQLTDSVSSTSTTTAATPNAVKTANDLATAALPKSGGTMTGAITFNAGQTIVGYGLLDGAQTWTQGQRGEITALTDGATITPDFANSNNFSVTLGGNRTLANPTNLVAGQSGCIWITQDGTGSRTLAYGSQWDFAGGVAPTLSISASAVDCLVYAVQSSTRITTSLIAGLS